MNKTGTNSPEHRAKCRICPLMTVVEAIDSDFRDDTVGAALMELLWSQYNMHSCRDDRAFTDPAYQCECETPKHRRLLEAAITAKFGVLQRGSEEASR